MTIKDIALHSGVSEMTVYRHFKTKLGLLEAAVQQFSYIPAFQRVFENDITWNLEKDLTLIAESVKGWLPHIFGKADNQNTVIFFRRA